MKIGNRVTRFALSMALAGAIYTQIPVGNGLAAAYGGGGGGKTVVAAAAIAGAVYTISTVATGGGALPPASVPVFTTPGGASAAPLFPVYDVAASNGDFSTLASLLDKAGLKDDMKRGGPYTVFAPTNAAFDALKSANPTLFADLQKKENKAQLKSVLQYHVVNGRYTIADLKGMAEDTKLVTLNGNAISITNADGLKVNGIPVQESDIPAANGIIHPIGEVLTPNTAEDVPAAQ